MKVIDTIKVYVKYPKCIIYDIRDKKSKLIKKFYHKLKQMVYSYENETFYMKNMYENFGKDGYCDYMFPDKTVTFARMNPVMMIIREIDLYFENYNKPQIGTIEVNNQDKETITVTIHTENPGNLIGSHGKNINYFRNRLSELFNKKTEIKIIEIKNNIDKPVYFGY